MAYRIMAAVVTAVTLLSGCGAQPANRRLLTQYQEQCAAGDYTACTDVTHQEKVNSDEARARYTNAAKILFLPVVMFGAVLQAEAAGQPGSACYFLERSSPDFAC